MQTLLRHRWWFFFALVVLLGALAPGVKTAANPDNSLTVWFLKTDPKLDAYHKFQELFGNDEIIILQVHSPEGIFTAKTLGQLRRAQADLAQIDGVARVSSILDAVHLSRAQPQHTTTGLLNLKLPQALNPPTLKREALIPEPTPPQDELDQIKARALKDPTVAGLLINEDATRTLMLIQMKVMGDIDTKRNAIVDELRTRADQSFAQTEHPIAGIGVIYAGLNEITTHDFGLFVTLGYLIMFGMLWLVFRSIRLVLAAIGVIFVGTWISLGVYGLLGNQLNTMTIVLPTLIIVLGIADAVHFPVIYLRLSQAPDAPSDRLTLAANGLKEALLPCALTTLTTVAGFLALVSSPMGVIKDMGIYASLGLLAALAASALLMALAFMSIKPDHKLPELRWITGMTQPLARQLQRAPKRWAALCALLIALGTLGASQVKIDTYTLGALPDDHVVVRDHQHIERGFGPYSTLEFLLKPTSPQARVDDPELLAATEAFAKAAAALPHIGQVIHLGRFYRHGAKTLDPSLSDDSPLPPHLVRAAQALAQDPALVWAHDDPKIKDNPLAAMMTPDGKVARVTMTSQMLSAKELGRLLDQLSSLAKTHLGEVATLEPTGYPPLYVSIIDYVMQSQVNGFLIACGLILLIMLLWLRSPRLAIISLLPNLFPVLMMLGVMGALKIDLDIATATVAAIVIGVAIDDTIHFVHAWRGAEAKGHPWAMCLEHTFEHAGKAAVVTTALLVTGFPVLMLADVATVFDFGLLTSVAAIAALFGDLVMLPLLLRAWPPTPKNTPPTSPHL